MMLVDAIVTDCQRGRPGAYGALFEKYKDLVHSVARRYSKDRAVSQDAAHDTFLKLFSVIGSFRGDSGFDAWLYRLVVNCCMDERRRTRRLTPLGDDLSGSIRARDASALDRLQRSESRGRVRAVVARLPAEHRILLRLRYTDELPYEEIAGILGCSPGTVGSKLNRVHKVLQRRLSPYCSSSLTTFPATSVRRKSRPA
jgi:RNA polymerase sigma-70 factor (ECF subfamily)